MKRLSLFILRSGIVLMLLALISFTAGIFNGVMTIGVAMAAGAAEVVNPDAPPKAVTTQEQKEKSPELLVDTVSKRITEMKPSLHPIDTILRKIGRTQKSRSWKYDYYAVDVRGIRDNVTEDTPKTIAAIDAPTTDWNKAFDIKAANMHIWQQDDNIIFQNVEGSDGGQLMGNIVQKKTSDQKLSVMFVNRKEGAFDIPSDCALTRIGNSKSELDAQTSPYAVLPQKDFNYCQIHMAQVEESVFAKLHDKQVAWDISDYQAQSIYDMRRSMELTSINGARGLLVDPEDEQQKYFSGGLIRFIEKKIDLPFDEVITNNMFVDWMEFIFTGNSGADKRFLFAGNSLISQLSKVPTIQKQIDAKQTEVVYGITFSKIESNFGVLLIKHHNLMTEVGLNMTGLVLDMNNIERAVFRAMNTRTIDLIKSGQRMANAYVIDETFCLASLYPDTHCIIGQPDEEETTTPA